MESDSSDEELPGVAGQIRSRLQTPKHGRSLQGMTAEALNSAGARPAIAINTTLDSSAFELQLKQQAAVFIRQRESEIESYHATLNEALAEVKRMRVAEEARLAERVAAVHEAFGTRLAELQAEYRRNVEELERGTSAHLEKLRQESEAVIASRVRALSSHISPVKAPISQSVVGTPRAVATPRARSELPAFLTPQAARGGNALFSPHHRPPGSTSRVGGGTTQRVLFGALDSSGHGLHRSEPRVLDLLIPGASGDEREG